MRLLLTNDDGIRAPGILALREALLLAGHEVCMVAPSAERSANSHAITWKQPLGVRKLAEDTYEVDGTPADCTHLGLLKFCTNADFVVSGINAGANTGNDTHYSGTVAAAMEGVLQGIPSLAVSRDFARHDDYTAAAAYAVTLLKHLAQHPMPKGMMCNLNVPAVPIEQIKGLRLATLDTTSALGDYEQFDNSLSGAWYFLSIKKGYQGVPGSDCALLSDGYATVSYLGRNTAMTPPHALPQ